MQAFTGGAARRGWSVLALFAAIAALLAAPSGLGFSRGITGENAGLPEFEAIGCVACHGSGKQFEPLDNSVVKVQVIDAEGTFLNGVYEAEAQYTIRITLDEQVGADAAQHAGFNLRVTAGALSAVEGQSQVSTDTLQATHVDATRTSWDVGWKAPAQGAVGFRLFVNDVDGDGTTSAGDQPRQLFFGFTDESGAALGAAAEEEEVHFGISLQQYWIGLIGLAGMLFIMVGGYVYLKYVNPHNTDEKDR